MSLHNWNRLKQPPAWALKQIQAGRLKGKSDINPQWRYQAMTEVYGECGCGWKYSIDNLWFEEAAEGQRFAFAQISLQVKCSDGEWSDPIPGIGGHMLLQKEKSGIHANDEAYKMAVTDALSTAMKMLGVAADVYAGLWDGSKYAEAGPAAQVIVDLDTLKDQVDRCETMDELKQLYNEWRKQIEQATNKSDANTLFNNRKAALSQQADSSSSQSTQQQQNQNPEQGSDGNSKQSNSSAQLITQKQQQLLNSQLGVLGYKDKQDRLDWINTWLERQGLDYVQESTKELTKDTGSKIIETVKTEVQKQHDEGNPLNGNSEDMDEDLFREPAEQTE